MKTCAVDASPVDVGLSGEKRTWVSKEDDILPHEGNEQENVVRVAGPPSYGRGGIVDFGVCSKIPLR